MTWTYLSPPPVHFAPGERTGRYRTGLDRPVVGDDGQARISDEDYAAALVDEIDNPRHLKRRFTVGY
ncbi:NAD(P)-dependent oxidoreductase [Streptomyces sp. NPDC015661]|uniref:NAD(P)-dependent oxidoreductase n=1 Tax=Streptomyces sp. NPDC015661 TaxID=3364961 RepID=UPI0036FD00A1